MRSLAKRPARLEGRSDCRWYTVEVGINWQGDVKAALGIAPGDGDVLLVIKRYANPDAPPRLAGQPSSRWTASEGREA